MDILQKPAKPPVSPDMIWAHLTKEALKIIACTGSRGNMDQCVLPASGPAQPCHGGEQGFRDPHVVLLMHTPGFYTGLLHFCLIVKLFWRAVFGDLPPDPTSFWHRSLRRWSRSALRLTELQRNSSQKEPLEVSSPTSSSKHAQL